LNLTFSREPEYKAEALQTEILQGVKETMLWTIFIILLVAWLLGFVGFHVVAWYIHLLLVVALVVLLIQLIGGGRRTVV
jgi:uncharacterized membrane protein YtjA (UPF0391 family)